ncbi:MAG: type II toxin-antitoxin system VapC family toxin [Chloroflexota bacterium]
MFLKDYVPRDKIFVDANVFIYHALDEPSFGGSSSDFLGLVESGEIEAITDTLVVDEVFFKILMGKASELMEGLTLKRLKKRIAEDAELRKSVYSSVESYEEYISVLLATGLEIVEVNTSLVKEALRLGTEYGLLISDSVHLAAMRRFGICDMATNDSDFERVHFVRVWKPLKH